MQIFFSLLLFILSFNLYADGSVRFADLEDDIGPGAESLIRVNNGASGNSGFFFAEYTEPGGDGTSSSAPGTTWIPVDNGVDNQRENVTIADKTLVPSVNSPSNGQFQAFLEVTNATGSDRYLYAAVQDPSNASNYKVITSASGPFVSNANSYLSWRSILIENLCDPIESACDDLRGSDSSVKNVLIYFFLSNQSNLGINTNINPTSATGGVFLRLYLSSAIPTSTIDLQELRRGDGRLKAIFNGSTMNDPNRTLAVINGTGGGMSAGTVQAALAVPGSQLLDLESVTTSGEVTIKPLFNNVTYEVVLLFEDKFQLATKVSAPLTETPQQIEALLEKQACYILSAGFGEKHFITDYFRALRDKVLLHTRLGTSFVNWYYNTAPHYTPLIYSSPSVAFVVRCLAFMAWFLINLTLLAVPIVIVVWALKKLSRGKTYGRSQ